jgi:hypothetical protein
MENLAQTSQSFSMAEFTPYHHSYTTELPNHLPCYISTQLATKLITNHQEVIFLFAIQ